MGGGTRGRVGKMLRFRFVTRPPGEPLTRSLDGLMSILPTATTHPFSSNQQTGTMRILYRVIREVVLTMRVGMMMMMMTLLLRFSDWGAIAF